MPDDTRDIILRIYDTIADQGVWAEALDRVARRIDARGCVIIEWPQPPGDQRLAATHCSGSFDPATIQQYIEQCAPWEIEDWKVFEAHSRRRDEIDLIDDSVLAPDLDSLRRRGNVQALDRFGILHRAAGLLNKDNNIQSRFSIQFGAERGRPTGDERRWMGEVLPHIAKALALGQPARETGAQNMAMLSAIDRLAVGVCVLDATGAVVVRNSEFDRQLDAYDVFRVDRNGQLRLTADKDQARFDALRREVMNHGRFGARPRKEAVGAADDAFLCIELAPVDRLAALGTAPLRGCIVYSQDPARPVRCDVRAIQTAYGLTDAEASLVELIADGLTNNQIAEAKGRKTSTINAQVKSILSKTDCATRTQFVRLMMSFGASYLAPPN